MQMTRNQNKPAQLDGGLILSFVLHTHRISADGLNAGANIISSLRNQQPVHL